MGLSCRVQVQPNASGTVRIRTDTPRLPSGVPAGNDGAIPRPAIRRKQVHQCGPKTWVVALSMLLLGCCLTALLTHAKDSGRIRTGFVTNDRRLSELRFPHAAESTNRRPFTHPLPSYVESRRLRWPGQQANGRRKNPARFDTKRGFVRVSTCQSRRLARQSSTSSRQLDSLEGPQKVNVSGE